MESKLLSVDMTEDQAWAYAAFLHQVAAQDYRKYAADDAEAQLMYDAGEAIRQSLADVGVVPN